MLAPLAVVSGESVAPGREEREAEGGRRGGAPPIGLPPVTGDGSSAERVSAGDAPYAVGSISGSGGCEYAGHGITPCAGGEHAAAVLPAVLPAVMLMGCWTGAAAAESRPRRATSLTCSRRRRRSSARYAAYSTEANDACSRATDARTAASAALSSTSLDSPVSGDGPVIAPSAMPPRPARGAFRLSGVGGHTGKSAIGRGTGAACAAVAMRLSRLSRWK